MSQLVIWPLLLPLLVGTLLLLSRGWLPLRLRRGFSLVGVLGLIGLALALFVSVADGSILTYRLGNWPPPFGIVLVADRLAAGMVLLTALLALPALLYALGGTDRAGRHFHPLFQWQLFGLCGAFLTGDLFNLFVFFEVLLIASYGLLLHGGGAARTRAGLHFVTLNLLGSALFLIAAGTLYGTLGTLNMADLAVEVAAVPPTDLGLVRTAGLLLFVVFALKAALLPLHLWLPAAYAAAPAPVAALFAIMTKVGAYCLLRVDTLVFGADAGGAAGLYDPWLLPLGLATLLAGSLGALAATALRGQLAWLVVVSVGLLLTAFGLDRPAAVAAGLWYLAHSTLAGAALFLLADLIAAGRGRAADRLNPAPALPRAGLVGGLFLFGAVLIAGLPPLSGFVGKLLVLQAALALPAWPWVFALVLGAGLLGVIALARSGSVLFLAAGPVAEGSAGLRGIAFWQALGPVLLLYGLCVALLVGAGPVAEFTAAAAAQLFSPADYIGAVLGQVASNQ